MVQIRQKISNYKPIKSTIMEHKKRVVLSLFLTMGTVLSLMSQTPASPTNLQADVEGCKVSLSWQRGGEDAELSSATKECSLRVSNQRTEVCHSTYAHKYEAGEYTGLNAYVEDS